MMVFFLAILMGGEGMAGFLVVVFLDGGVERLVVNHLLDGRLPPELVAGLRGVVFHQLLDQRVGAVQGAGFLQQAACLSVLLILQVHVGKVGEVGEVLVVQVDGDIQVVFGEGLVAKRELAQRELIVDVAVLLPEVQAGKEGLSGLVEAAELAQGPALQEVAVAIQSFRVSKALSSSPIDIWS